MKLRDFFYLWGPVIIWCSVIFGLSSIPTAPTPEIIWWDFILKKTAHVVEYAILYFLMYKAFNKLKIRDEKHKTVSLREICHRQTIKNLKFSKIQKTNWTTPFLFCLLYAVSDEYHQKFVPGRHMKLMDVGFDVLGIMISYLKLEIYA